MKLPSHPPITRWTRGFVALGILTAGCSGEAGHSGSAPKEDLRFNPSKATPATKHFILDLQLERLSSTTSQDGEPFSESPTPTHRVTVRREAQVRDSYDRIDGQFPSGFRRTYERLTLTGWRESVHGFEAFSFPSPVEEKTVHFDWDSQSGDWQRALAERDPLAESVLSALVGDLDFATLSKLVRDQSSGSDCLVETSELIRPFLPWDLTDLGYPHRDPDSEDWPSVHVVIVPELPPCPDFWLQGLRSEAKLGLGSPREQAGRRLQPISIALNSRDAAGVEALMEDVIEALGEPTEDHRGYIEMLNYAGDGLTWSLEGTGELVWDTTRNCFESLELEADIDLNSDLTWSYEWETPRVTTIAGSHEEQWQGKLVLRAGRGPLPDTR